MHIFDEGDAVVHTGADLRFDHLAEPGAHALLLLLDDVEPAGRHAGNNNDHDPRKDPPAAPLDGVEKSVNDACTRRQ